MIVVGTILIVIGAALSALGAIGVLRFPDVYTRLHAASKAGAPGVGLILLGMGIVNPLGTAQALSPFGEKAGAASALLGFWQMMGAAIGVWLATAISHDAMTALGLVLMICSLLALLLYTMRARKT